MFYETLCVEKKGIAKARKKRVKKNEKKESKEKHIVI